MIAKTGVCREAWTTRAIWSLVTSEKEETDGAIKCISGAEFRELRRRLKKESGRAQIAQEMDLADDIKIIQSNCSKVIGQVVKEVRK